MNSLILAGIIFGIIMVFGVSFKIYKSYLQTTENNINSQIERRPRRVFRNQEGRRRIGSTVELERVDTVDIPLRENHTVFVDTVTGRIETVQIVDPTPVVILQEPDEPGCPHCGKENDKTSLFCVYCGTEL